MPSVEAWSLTMISQSIVWFSAEFSERLNASPRLRVGMIMLITKAPHYPLPILVVGATTYVVVVHNVLVVDGS